MSAEATQGWSTVFQGEVVGRTQLSLLSRSVAAFAEARTRYPAAQFVDVQYDEFVEDPVGTVRAIYEAFDLPWTTAVATEVARLDATSRSGARRPSHRYDLSDYGLTAAEVRAAF